MLTGQYKSRTVAQISESIVSGSLPRTLPLSEIRAVRDQGPHGYPVLEIEPMVRSETLLTTIVALSLERPHFFCKESWPEGLAWIESPSSCVQDPTHAQKNIATGKREEKERRLMKKGEIPQEDEEGGISQCIAGLNC